MACAGLRSGRTSLTIPQMCGIVWRGGLGGAPVRFARIPAHLPGMTTRASTPGPTIRHLTARLRRQDGMQLVELLVGAAIMGVVALIAVTVIFNAAMLVTRSSATTATLSDLQDASGQLLRDVNDGRKILVAGDDAITVQVVRDSVCTQREWSVQGQDFQVVTTTYSTDSCTGGAESTSTMAVIDDQLVSAHFDYFSSLSQRGIGRQS